ncbi:MAG: L-seryl-tRNA(Sec) selenium transferase [Peptostreptococcaceae bacterium]|nr:L-seryl-tRNA(Sec) selenium transferase [Peptostreptococcaceae bacterium]
MNNEMMRKIPKIDEVLQEQCLFVYLEEMPKVLVMDSIRECISELRTQVSKADDNYTLDYNLLLADIVNRIEKKKKLSMREVINATGTVIHTNLGRSKLSDEASKAAVLSATSYSNLEYDLAKGGRGLRHTHVEYILKKLTGVEAAMVVNNNAAATMLTLSAMGYGKEMIVSRGELVEIGGSFRIPDIMMQSGCSLKEVGATNKTKLSDYEMAIDDEKTAALMKVHTSNYKIVGFTEDVSLDELVKLGYEKSLPVIYDMGSGLMVNLTKYGVSEPTVLDAVKSGIDVALFSGDKLLGGPQCGIIIGKSNYIDKLKRHPLARALRVDKMTLASLEVTLRTYLDEDKALVEIPTLKMITSLPETIKKKAEKLSEELNEICDIKAEVVETKDQIGGGSAPTTYLDGYGVSISHKTLTSEKLERKLRNSKTPIICRIYKDKIIFVLRTVGDDEIEVIAKAIKEL